MQRIMIQLWTAMGISMQAGEMRGERRVRDNGPDAGVSCERPEARVGAALAIAEDRHIGTSAVRGKFQTTVGPLVHPDFKTFGWVANDTDGCASADGGEWRRGGYSSSSSSPSGLGKNSPSGSTARKAFSPCSASQSRPSVSMCRPLYGCTSTTPSGASCVSFAR